MAGFVFRMQSYLGIKEKIEEQKKLEYGKSLAKVEEEKQKKENLVLRQEASIEELRKSIQGGVHPQEIDSFNRFIRFMKKSISEQETVIEKAVNEAEKKRVELVEAMKERKMLETLKEKDKEEYMKNILSKEQKATDEIVSYQYNK